MLDIPEKILMFDTETTGLWPWPTRLRIKQGCAFDRPFAFSFCNLNEETFYFRGEVNPETREVAWDDCREEVEWFRDIIANPEITLAAHNIDFDRRMVSSMAEDQGFSRRWGWAPKAIEWNCELWDTVASAHTCRPDEINFMLKRLARVYCDIPMDDEKALHRAVVGARRRAKKAGWMYAREETHGKKPVNADYWLVEGEELEEYARLDAYRVLGLYLFHIGILDQNEENGGKLWEIFRQEQALHHVTYRMTNNGMGFIDQQSRALQNYYNRHLDRYRLAMDGLGFPDFDSNKASPSHLGYFSMA